jgi:hypothetical protein
VTLVRRLGADAAVDGRTGDLADALQQSHRMESMRSSRSQTVRRWTASSRVSKKGVGSRILTASSPSRRDVAESA